MKTKKTLRRSWAAVLALLLLGALTASAEDVGWIEHDGVRMPVEGAAAVWDEGRGRLRICLLPFELRDEEVELCRTNDVYSIQRPGLDEEKWPHWSPIGYLDLSWIFAEAPPGEVEEATYELIVQGIAAKNHGTSGGGFLSNHQPEIEIGMDWKGAPGGEVTMESRGREVRDGVTLAWQLDLKTEVLAAIE